MTKTSALPVVAVAVALLAVRWRGRGVLAGIIVLLVVAAMTGWWFARNVRLYGDWSGAKAVANPFGTGGKYRVTSPGDWARAARSVVTYYSLPVEYWRNEVKASWFCRGLVAGSLMWLGGGGIAWAVTRGRRRASWADHNRPWGALVVAGFTVAGLVFWLAICFRDYVVAPRVGMSGLAGVAVLVAVANRSAAAVCVRNRRSAAAALAALATVLLALDASMLGAVRRIPPHRPYEIQLSGTVVQPGPSN